MKDKSVMGNVLAFITMVLLGTTYISTKILLKNLAPMEILFYRFLIAYCVLLLIHPKFRKPQSIKEELLYMAAGLTGVTLYYLVENIALQYTLASNVGLFSALAPILTAVLSNFFIEHGAFTKELVYGFLIAIAGVFLVIFNGNFILKINPLGDCLAILAALLWSVYSILLKMLNNKYEHHYIYTTRKIFFYGLIFMIPVLVTFRIRPDFGKFLLPGVLPNILFLGFIASALCFVMWNVGVKIIGAVKASNYIYIVPLITALTSVIVLKEKITSVVVIGAVLILSGLYISQNGLKIPIKSFNTNRKKVKGEAAYGNERSQE